MQYRFKVPIPLRWGDQDAMGHINNAKFLTYFEEARVRFFEKLGATVASGALSGQAPILAKIACTFTQQLRWPGTIEVGVGITRIGTKSFSIGHAVHQPGSDAVAAHGEAVIVWFDYATQQTAPLPDALRDMLEAWT